MSIWLASWPDLLWCTFPPWYNSHPKKQLLLETGGFITLANNTWLSTFAVDYINVIANDLKQTVYVDIRWGKVSDKCEHRQHPVAALLHGEPEAVVRLHQGVVPIYNAWRTKCNDKQTWCTTCHFNWQSKFRPSSMRHLAKDHAPCSRRPSYNVVGSCSRLD